MKQCLVYLQSGLVIVIVWALVEFVVEQEPVKLPGYLVAATTLLLCAYVVFRILVRRDYLINGRLRFLATFLQVLIWGVFSSFPYLYNPANWACSIVAVLVCAGLGGPVCSDGPHDGTHRRAASAQTERAGV